MSRHACCEALHNAASISFNLAILFACKEEVHNFRLMQRRFIVYEPSKATPDEQACGSSQASSHMEPQPLPGTLLHYAITPILNPSVLFVQVMQAYPFILHVAQTADTCSIA